MIFNTSAYTFTNKGASMIVNETESEVMKQDRQSEMIVCSFFCLGGMIRMTEGDITGISDDAPDEAKKAFRHFMKLMQDPHRNV